jgi:plasmid maintenance system antidote protein VapI
MPHPRLPAAPLKRVLKRLQASESLTWEELADRIGVTERHLCRILTARDLSERVADRITCRIGLHPLLLWPKEWSRIGRSEASGRSQNGQAV